MAGNKGVENSSEGESQPLEIAVAGSSRPAFISYASQDAALAQEVCTALEAAGFPCWIAPRDVVPGTLYADGIVQALDESRVLVLILSKDAVASAHVGRELERAVSKRHPVIALKVDSAPLNRAFEYFLNQSQWIEAGSGGMDAAIAKLVEAVGRHLAAGNAAAPTQTLVAPLRKAATSRRNWVIGAAIVVIALVAAYFLAGRLHLKSPATIAVADKSIAVLPFVDMSEKKDQEYFADGMAEEIIDLLAKVPDLRVPARTSSFYFKGKSTKVSEIARELGVAQVLEGSIRRSGDRIRVTAQLVRADNGYHLWSETYDRPLDDVFKVQDEIANAVVQALQISLMGGPLARQKGGTENLEAYQLYLRALNANAQNTRASLEAEREYLDRAIKLDPAFGLAWVAMAYNSTLLADNGGLSQKEGYEHARQLDQHALEISPDLAAAHAGLQYVYTNYDGNWAAAEVEGRQALNLDPTDPNVLLAAAILSRTLGHWDDAERQLRLALVRDPLNPLLIWNVGTTLYGAHRFADAEVSYRRILEVAPDFLWTRAYLGKTLLAEGRGKDALAMVQPESDEAMRLMYLPVILRANGRKDEADDALKTLTAKYADYAAYYVAVNYAYRDERDLAFQWLDRAYRQRDTSLIELMGEPLFKNIKGDPRYKAFMKKMNFPDE
jgi:TolB-like protein/Flp pilus assembly protein TadD